MKTKHLFTTLLAGLMVVAMTACGSTLASQPEYDSVLTTTDAIPTETTTQGDAGENVEALQKYLTALGFLDDVADGQFGENTKNAIINFQKTYGITVTGEADEETLDMLTMLVDSIATEPEDGEYVLTMFRSINILRYDDGKYYVEPNTVSDKTFESAEAALKAVISAFKESSEVPVDDYTVQVLVDELADINVVDGAVNINTLKNFAAKNDGYSFVDAGGNAIEVTSDGTITSDTGNIYVRTVDYDDNSIVIADADNYDVETVLRVEMKSLEDNIGNSIADGEEDSEDDGSSDSENESVTVVTTYSFRNIVLNEMDDDSFAVDINVVSERTLDEFRKAYTAIRYAYLHSTEIPTSDVETRVQIDVDNLPENVTMNDLTYDESTDSYYITTRDIQRIADEVGVPVTVKDSDGNQVTVDRLGDTTTDTGNIVSQVVNKDTNEPETKEFVNKPVEEATQPETKPSEPVAEIPAETEVPTTVVTEPETEKPTTPSQPNTPSQPSNPTQPTKPEQPTDKQAEEHVHDWVEVTKVVHHDAVTHTEEILHEAVTHTVTHPAETHEETVYKTVHHDAVYNTVHHDAVTASTWVVDSPAEYIVTQYIAICTADGCGEKFYGATQKEANKAWLHHSYDAHGNNAGYTSSGEGYWTDEIGHYEDVVVSEAWDEQVLVSDAWDEEVPSGTKTVIDFEPWDETVVDVKGWKETITVVDKEAWDEVVVTGYKCSECGATK